MYHPNAMGFTVRIALTRCLSHNNGWFNHKVSIDNVRVTVGSSLRVYHQRAQRQGGVMEISHG